MKTIRILSFNVTSILIAGFAVATISGRDLAQLTVPDFTIFFNTVYIGITLLLLLMLIIAASLTNNSHTKTGTWWVIGFGVTLILSIATSYYANPHARFPSQRYLFINILARNLKTNLFEKIDYNPQLIILGSSRAFTIESDYVDRKTGYKTFNFSVESGTVVDYFWQLNYILDHEKEALQPLRTLVIDVAPSIPSGLIPATQAEITFSKQPLAMLPYISLDYQKDVLFQYGEDIVSSQSLSDSLYLMAHSSLTPQAQAIIFQSDGFGLRKPTTHEDYVNNMKSNLVNVNDYGYFCAKLDSQGEELLTQLVSTAEKHNIGVVLYVSPVNGTVLEKILLKKGPFNRCQKLWADFMNSLKSKHPNVWYRNLIDYQPITNMKEDGFYDIMHLRENASQAVIDQLMPSIQAAGHWSEAQSK